MAGQTDGVRPEKHAASIRKIQANRQNALKSTGPRSPRGKAHSRQNALKHGLFAMDIFIWDGAKRESRQQYEQLLDRMVEDYQPVGAAEQLEVERIAACWWKLGRAWRYENAEIFGGHLKLEMRLIEIMSGERLSPEDQARLALLRTAKAEIEATDGISDELRGKLFVNDPEFREQWNLLDKLANERVAELLDRAGIRPPVAKQLARDPAYMLLLTTELAIRYLEHKVEFCVRHNSELAYDRVAIPESEALDRVLRADAAADRGINRAIDRLERLQRRRKGEPVLPPMSVRLTQ